ncbi:hypothetical protein ACFLZT_02185 [Thermodesulfobacteriota bacterium]
MTGYYIIGAIVILCITTITIIIAMRPQRRTNVSTRNITVSLAEGPKDIASSLSYKGWFQFSFAFIGGTISASPRTAPYTVAPINNTTTTPAPDCYFTITGVALGTGFFTVDGSSIEGKHPGKRIDVTVVP